VRFLKASALAAALGLTAKEMAHFATPPTIGSAPWQPDAVDGDGWLNVCRMPTTFTLQTQTAPIARALNGTLLTPLQALLDYARIKADIAGRRSVADCPGRPGDRDSGTACCSRSPDRMPIH
jgi:hypothetical protein